MKIKLKYSNQYFRKNVIYYLQLYFFKVKISWPTNYNGVLKLYILLTSFDPNYIFHISYD